MKTTKTLSLDLELVAWLKPKGRKASGFVNDALRALVESPGTSKQDDLERWYAVLAGRARRLQIALANRWNCQPGEVDALLTEKNAALNELLSRVSSAQTTGIDSQQTTLAELNARKPKTEQNP